MKAHQRITLSAILAAILFGIGYVMFVFIPGTGGNTKDSDYTKFYNSDGKTAVSVVLFIVLFVGCLALLWFLNELRDRLSDDILARTGYVIGVVGVVGVLVGADIMGGPSNSVDGFVGANTASMLAQMGLTIALGVGMYSFGVMALLLTIAAVRQGLLPKWLNIVGVILAIATFGSFFWIPGYAFVAWVAVTGIVVGMRERAPVGAATTIATRAPAPVA